VDGQFSSQRKAQRRAREAEIRAAQEQRDATVLKALSRPNVEAKGRVDRFLEWHTTPERLRYRNPQARDTLLHGLDGSRLTEEFFDVLRVVETKAPKLMEKEYVEALVWACRIPLVLGQPFVRPPAEWEPRGKGRDSLFRSLVSHLLARFTVTPLLWTVFFDRNPGHKFALIPLVGFVAGGGSLVDYVTGKTEQKFPEFPVPLTRKMCHELLTMPSESFVSAVRRVQVRAAGGNERLLQAILGSRHYQTFGTRDNEEFMQTVIDWLCKNPMLNPAEIGPLLDYIAHRRFEDKTFSMKARGALATIRAMHAWHDGLAVKRSVSKTIFSESGFKPITVSMHRVENKVQVAETWRVRELLSAHQLADEGRRMNHCVYSYENTVAAGHVSIWSMTMEDGQGSTGNWSMLTIEVRNANKTIVQARGRFNRVATPREHGVLARWAQENGLSISLGRWG
jgi:hypothetical protein